MKLKLLEAFTIEVPRQDGDYDILEGKFLPTTKKFEKEIEDRYEEQISKAKALQKKANQLMRLEQSIQINEQKINIGATTELIAKKESLLNEAYSLQDEVETLNNELKSFDMLEIKAREHITARLRAEEDAKNKIIQLCETYGYKMMFETILEDIEEKGKLEGKN